MLNRLPWTRENTPLTASPVKEVGAADWSDCSGSIDGCWHPKIARFYDYWRVITPAAGLPGRQHVDAADIPDLLAHTWLIDVESHPNGCRFRYRLVGTTVVKSMARELTGAYLHEAEGPQSGAVRRYQEMLDSRQPTYRKGLFTGAPNHPQNKEDVIVPLARDGLNVDMMMGCAVFFPAQVTR